MEGKAWPSIKPKIPIENFLSSSLLARFTTSEKTIRAQYKHKKQLGVSGQGFMAPLKNISS
jgi:hypothetical protein